ncbi:MAG: hypothetical protein HQM10_26830 [Candidatus Riflebacteria bacterium]|nr:hypothetical protein [Candidatus Riflebacteria bacterium]
MPRKKIAIDPVQVETLARLGATNTEIAAFFGVDEGTIRKRFSEFLTKGRQNGKIKLRTLQWRAAEKGNVAMLIFLGKNILKQSDKTVTEHTGIDGKPIAVEDVSESQARKMAEEFIRTNAQKSE